MFVWFIKILIYGRIDGLEGNGFGKTDKSKECMNVIVGFSKIKTLILENLIYNDCHDISLMCHELGNIAIFK